MDLTQIYFTQVEQVVAGEKVSEAFNAGGGTVVY